MQADLSFTMPINFSINHFNIGIIYIYSNIRCFSVITKYHKICLCWLGPVHIAKVVPEEYRYVGSAVYVNALCRQ